MSLPPISSALDGSVECEHWQYHHWYSSMHPQQQYDWLHCEGQDCIQPQDQQHRQQEQQQQEQQQQQQQQQHEQRQHRQEHNFCNGNVHVNLAQHQLCGIVGQPISGHLDANGVHSPQGRQFCANRGGICHRPVQMQQWQCLQNGGGHRLNARLRANYRERQRYRNLRQAVAELEKVVPKYPGEHHLGWEVTIRRAAVHIAFLMGNA